VVVDEAYGPQLVGGLSEEAKPLVVVRGDPDTIGGLSTVGLADLAEPERRAPTLNAHHDDVVTIAYTSGTTGRSKGVVLTHHYWLTATEAMSSGRDIRASDVLHSCTPMFHAGAWLLNVYPSLLYGLPLGIDGRFSVRDYWVRVRHYGATQLFTLGAMHMWLWEREQVPEETDNPARIWTAVPLANELVAPFRHRFGLDGVFSAYGQTEVMPATMGDALRPAKPGSSGRPQSSLDVRVVDDTGTPLPAGATGEIVIRPRRPHAMFEGYLGFPPPAADIGWFHTGDLGRLDDDGDLFFVDRKADHIRRRGHNVSSAEIEEAVSAHPAVADVAAYAVAADDAEDEVMITVVRRPGAQVTVDDLLAFCADRLPSYALPRYIDWAPDLPRTATGKIEKYRLREAGVTPTTIDLNPRR